MGKYSLSDICSWLLHSKGSDFACEFVQTQEPPVLMPWTLWGPINFFVDMTLASCCIRWDNNMREQIDKIVEPVDSVQASPIDTVFVGGTLKIERRTLATELRLHILGRLSGAIHPKVINKCQQIVVRVHLELLLDI